MKKSIKKLQGKKLKEQQLSKVSGGNNSQPVHTGVAFEDMVDQMENVECSPSL